MAGLIGLVRSGRFANEDIVIWLHTGGSPGLFAYPAVMARASQSVDLHGGPDLGQQIVKQ